jgi:hypothetical protein
MQGDEKRVKLFTYQSVPAVIQIGQASCKPESFGADGNFWSFYGNFE